MRGAASATHSLGDTTLPAESDHRTRCTAGSQTAEQLDVLTVPCQHISCLLLLLYKLALWSKVSTIQACEPSNRPEEKKPFHSASAPASRSNPA
eukprot:4542185-Prymnesium_polylepis.1